MLPKAIAIAATLMGGMVACAPSPDYSERTATDAGLDATAIALPPVGDATFGYQDVLAHDRVPFPCGALSGAMTAQLNCDRLPGDFGWVFDPDYAVVGVRAVINDEMDTGVPGPVVVTVLTPPPVAPLKETCANLPPLPPDSWVAFHAGFDVWSAGCNSTTEVEPGSSFELSITSVGVLVSDALGADPLDASADGFDWDAQTRELQTMTFRGSLKATLVAADGGTPLYLTMTF